MEKWPEEILTSSRCYATIHLANIAHNFALVRQCLPQSCQIMAVVKADAYGHGAPEVARYLAAQGAAYFAVATTQEALSLREQGLSQPILILSASPPALAPLLAQLELRQTVASLSEARAYAAALAATPGRQLRIHLKLDTGMGRLGFAAQPAARAQSLAEIALLKAETSLNLEGIFTHFADAGNPCPAYQEQQFAYFSQCLAELAQAGLHFQLRHCANSATIFRYPQMALDMVRPGIALYGGGADFAELAAFRPSLSLYARISQIRTLTAGETVSYGRTWTASRPCRVGVVEAGYADGLHRSLSNKAIFTLQGQPIRQIGTICMDRHMVDLSPLPEVEVGASVCLLGGLGADYISANEQAARAGTINYELFCSLSQRVPRLYCD